MSGRGRKPKPTHLKLVTGNPGKRPLNQAEPQSGPIGDVPADMKNPVARAKWHEVTAPEYWGDGRLRASDRTALRNFCMAWAEMIRAEEMVEENGPLVLTPNNMTMKSPWATLRDQKRAEIAKAVVEFGGTPSARSRVKADDVQKSEDPAAKFFG